MALGKQSRLLLFAALQTKVTAVWHDFVPGVLTVH